MLIFVLEEFRSASLAGDVRKLISLLLLPAVPARPPPSPWDRALTPARRPNVFTVRPPRPVAAESGA